MPQLNDNSILDSPSSSLKIHAKSPNSSSGTAKSSKDQKNQDELLSSSTEVVANTHPSSSSSPTILPPPPSLIESRYSTFLPKRVIPKQTSSFLRPGSCFIGTQQSGRSTYEVSVELKYVDMNESFLCGYLRIQGLTEDHPMLTTYFEGEMVGPKYSFFTRRAEWSTNDQNDLNHWSRFPPWRHISVEARNKEYVHENFDEQKHIFMRWKERFLVPDWRVRNIEGASYAGFYYICFNQVSGEIQGFYFHNKSDRFQQLALTHMPDSGAWPNYEFR